MTDVQDTPPSAGGQPPLDIGTIISGTFSLLFRHFPMFFILVFVPFLLMELVIGQFVQSTIDADPNDVGGMLLGFYASIIPFWIVFILLQAVLVRVAISLKLGQGAQIGAAVSAALRGFFPILLLGIVAGIAMAIGFLFLILPGLYLMAMFYVLIPAIVFENAGFNGLSRSLALTDGYRWPIIGVVVVMVIIIWIVSAVFGGLLLGLLFTQPGAIDSMATEPFAYPWWYGLMSAVVNAATTPLTLIPVAMIYARLKEIKEGGSAGDLLKVFE